MSSQTPEDKRETIIIPETLRKFYKKKNCFYETENGTVIDEISFIHASTTGKRKLEMIRNKIEKNFVYYSCSELCHFSRSKNNTRKLEGSYGEVKVDLSLGIAVKTLKDTDNEDSFNTEVGMYRLLEKTGCVPVMYHFDPVLYRFYIHAGRNFKNYFRQSTFTEKRRLITELFLCVKTLNENGVHHFDVKPENFVIVNEQVKIVDFSVSVYDPSLRSSYRKSGLMVKTYKPPEGFLNDRHSEFNLGKSDIFCTAICILDLLFRVNEVNNGGCDVDDTVYMEGGKIDKQIRKDFSYDPEEIRMYVYYTQVLGKELEKIQDLYSCLEEVVSPLSESCVLNIESYLGYFDGKNEGGKEGTKIWDSTLKNILAGMLEPCPEHRPSWGEVITKFNTEKMIGVSISFFPLPVLSSIKKYWEIIPDLSHTRDECISLFETCVEKVICNKDSVMTRMINILDLWMVKETEKKFPFNDLNPILLGTLLLVIGQESCTNRRPSTLYDDFCSILFKNNTNFAPYFSDVMEERGNMLILLDGNLFFETLYDKYMKDHKIIKTRSFYDLYRMDDCYSKSSEKILKELV